MTRENLVSIGRTISFVVPAYNETAELPATLRSIHDAAREAGYDYEIVVADDASTDGTAELARKLGARVVSIARRQIAAARNAGAREAAGEVLIFVDADTHIAAEHIRGVLLRCGAARAAARASSLAERYRDGRKSSFVFSASFISG